MGDKYLRKLLIVGIVASAPCKAKFREDRINLVAQTIRPTSTVVGNTSVSDDSAKAVRLLSEMAEKQHRTFEEVFADPANKELAGRTYTQHHRSSPSYDAELEG